MFLALFAAGGGLVWQNREARAQFFHELEVARDGLNRLGAGYEPWQVYIYMRPYNFRYYYD